MFISASDNKDDRLSTFTDDVEVHFASRKKVEILAKARNLLLQCHFVLPQDVCLSSPRVAWELYHASRDALLLYEAIVPVKQERQLDGINQVAVLIHDDCFYLSQEILGLAFEYRLDFPSSINEFAAFVDLAPRFQRMAEEILHRQIQVVFYNLKEAIDGAEGFQNTHQMKQYESAKFSIDQVDML
ncbi:centromere/kinetochore protein, putative [Actinidia rufa]|uniref:Centromere/kinetochore protein, putative n=1 Tax=Actinidia rufa TaxID=165716 RepID=A0A7J0G3C6_9ERIC|nr:centromere/kinetochore protein, putative [Actinidia rufa]